MTRHVPKRQFQPSKKLQDARNSVRQQAVAHLHASGPRVVMEAMLELEQGKPLDSVLRRYSRIPVATYRAVGAGILPIHAEFEVAWRTLRAGGSDG